MVFDDDSIRQMFRAEYYTYERIRWLIRLCIAIAMIMLALFADLSVALKVICLLMGCWLITSRDFASKIQAERVLEKRYGMTSSVKWSFTNSEIRGDGKNIFTYHEVDRLVEDKAWFYIFKDRQSAVMVPKAALQPGEEEGFRKFIEKKTHKKWRKNICLSYLNLKFQ